MPMPCTALLKAKGACDFEMGRAKIRRSFCDRKSFRPALKVGIKSAAPRAPRQPPALFEHERRAEWRKPPFRGGHLHQIFFYFEGKRDEKILKMKKLNLN
jgi:hypothetical protein